MKDITHQPLCLYMEFLTRILDALHVTKKRWFLTAAAAAFALGFGVVGIALGGIVAGLALLAALTGFCTGCEAFKLGCRLTGKPFVSCPIPGARQ